MGALLEVEMSKKFSPLSNVQNTPREHFWKLQCRKSARRCGSTFRSQNVQSTLVRFSDWCIHHTDGGHTAHEIDLLIVG